MATEIEPNKQSVESALKGKEYYIDFYQREYVWGQESVITLLNDIFYHFELGWEKHKDAEISASVMQQYGWYYLNTYIINAIGGKIYVVDGQQRLTTLTLLAVTLCHQIEKMKNNQDLVGLLDMLKQCVFSNSGYGPNYNLDHEKRKEVMECIFSNKPYPNTYKNKTEENIVARYKDVEKYINDKFKEHTNSKQLHSFVLYFLKRIVLVELSTTQNDMPMIFEVINDRGEALLPFEILKGKLIGVLNKDDTEIFCQKWEECFTKLLENEDDFMTDLIKAQFIFKRNSKIEKKINEQYHRYIFENNEIAENLGFRAQDKNRISNIKNFISNDIVYYGGLYAKLLISKNSYFIYNEINELSGQYQNILSACKINDKEEYDKINSIAKEYDRLWVLLQLNGIYDSNNFQELSYKLNRLLKNAELATYRNIFNQVLEERIKEARNREQVQSLLEYQYFERRTYANTKTRFIRYLLARVEEFICQNIKENPKNNVVYITTKTGDKTGYHIEHILSRNEESMSCFKNEEEFEENRNMLGGLLLLKGRTNLSSKNELYKDKLKTYNASLVWGHSLCENFYHKTNKDFIEFNAKLLNSKNVSFKSYQIFDKNALHERTRLLYEIIKTIWEVE